MYMSQNSILVAVTLVTIMIIHTNGCFIRNCPRGGKRGIETTDTTTRQCMSCMGTGICVGANICCGQEIGCHIGTHESRQCAKENESLSPCTIPGSSCGRADDGKCVADGVCCTAESCEFDVSCRNVEQLKPELITLLKRLLASKRNNSDR